jgi:hypothetical protein
MARARLIRQLEAAYSGELAAAYAYRGHWRSLRDATERARIRQIEQEEWHHRRLVGLMLRELGGAPHLWREVRAYVVGRVLGLLSRALGWFLPMYGAGRLESRNVEEYAAAARCAVACGRGDLVDCLLTMAEVEWDHEAYFRSKVRGHAGLRLLRLWPAIAPRASIRAEHASRQALEALQPGGESEGASGGASAGASLGPPSVGAASLPPSVAGQG